MTLEFDPELIIPNDELSISEGAVHAWSNWSSITQEYYNNMLDNFSKKFNGDLKVPFKKINKKSKDILLYGEMHALNKDTGRDFSERFEGVIPILWQVYDKTNSRDVIKRLEGYMDYDTCEECEGARLRPEALAVKINEMTIDEVTSMTVENAFDFFKSINL